MTSDYPIVTTTHGDIKGIKRTALYGEEYFSFERIPYAQPPLGDLRFKAPLPIAPWTHLLDCTETADKPLQKNSFTGGIEGSEDCLYLNVYVRNLKTAKPLPVLIYIHGGAFQHGGATQELKAPDYFMQEDVILVTLNYRLDALGFLYFTDTTIGVPGNAGLKDQLAAVRWFKQNCATFNGDPDNITIFGESAGAASVHCLILNSKTEKFFHKAILMSGAVQDPWAIVEKCEAPFRLAKLNGYKGEQNDKEIYDFLMNIEGSKLVGNDLRTDQQRLKGELFVFGPVVETYETADCIIPTHPDDLVKHSWSNDIPIIIGGTSFEGLLRYPLLKQNPQFLTMVCNQKELLLPVEAFENKSLEESRKLGESILKMYNIESAEPTFDNMMKLADMISYRYFWIGFYRNLLLRLKYATAPTYLYRFDFDSPNFNLCRIKYCGPNIRGVAHGDDLSYLFYCKMAWKLEKDSSEYKTIRQMVSMWTAFAKNSNPNCEQIMPTVWTPVEDVQPLKCLNISNSIEMIDFPEEQKLAFWNNL